VADVIPPRLEVVVTESHEVALTILAGELDLSTAETLRRTLLRFDLNSRANVHMGLNGLSILESQGIGVIVSAGKRTRSSGATFQVMCETGTARATLELMGS
jgi:anti-anti-sigma factor